MRFRDRLSVFFALVLSTLSLGLASSALLTDFWIKADKMARNGTESAQCQMNSGLFHGVRQLDWALGPQRKHFSVFDDIQSGHSFMDRHIWFCLLFFSGLGLLWNFVGLMVALRNAAMIGGGGTGDGWESQADTVLGPLGICLWGVLAAVSYGLSGALFLFQFFLEIRHNVLLPDQLAAGFSSDNFVELGFSFWLLINATGTQLLPCILLFWAMIGSDKSGRMEEEAEGTKEETVFMY